MARPKLPLAPIAFFKALRELRGAVEDRRPIAVGGAKELAAALTRELTRGGDQAAVVEAGPERASALVYVLAGPPTAEDEKAFRAADRAGVPIICVVAGGGDFSVPYVLAEDVLRLGAGEGFPVDAIGEALGRRLDEASAPLAARLPAIRRGVSEAAIAKVARQNAVIAAAVFIPGVDMPVLTLNQIRLVLRLAAAHGHALDKRRAPEILAIVASAFGFRAVAHTVVGVVPLLGWAVQGAIAWAGTRAVGEAALRYLETASEPPSK
jgi:uncharacterized protein (DUF697 family)